MEIDYATSNITNSDDLREKIHEIHNYMRNNGIGYGLTSLKVFNLFYGLMKIEDYGLNDAFGLSDEKCKFSYLLKISTDGEKIIEILGEILDLIYENKEVKKFLTFNIPLDLKADIYSYLLNEIKAIKDIEKSSNEQLSGKIYEYFVNRDQSAISELGAYFTNRRIVNYCLDKIKPQLKSDGITIPKMIDMFGGSGGFTIGYMNYLNKNFKIDWKSQLNNIYHFDINEDVLKSAALEFFCLSGGIIPNTGNDGNIIRTNSFKQDFKDYGKYDLILTNPPYGGDKIATSGKKEKRDKIIDYITNEINLFKKKLIEKFETNEELKKKTKLLDDIKKPNTKIDKILKLISEIEVFKDNEDVKRIEYLYQQSNELKKENKVESENTKKLCVNIHSCSGDIIKFALKHKLKGTDKEACSLMLMMDLLAVNGTAVGVLKEGLFFDSAYSDLRKVLLTEFNVKEVISIPSNQFENTATKTSIVIFSNNEEYKTTTVTFSELKVNLYDNDEFIEKDNKVYLKFNKGDIKNVEEVVISTVGINQILQNDSFSLNHKDYNKVSIVCGDDFKLVRIGDVCEINKNLKDFEMSKYKYIEISNINDGNILDYTLYDKNKLPTNAKNLLNYNDILISSVRPKKSKIMLITKIIENINQYITSSALIKVTAIEDKNINYIYAILYLLCDNFEKELCNGSNYPRFKCSQLENYLIPIPKTQDLIDLWVSKISIPFNLKQEKEKRFKEIEEEIKMKIKDIQDNYECEEVRLGDICDINPKNNIINDNYINYIDIASIFNNNIETITKIFKPYPSRAKRNILKGDILYSSVRPNLKGYTYINETIYNGIASTGFILIRSIKINYLYIYHSLIVNNLTNHLVNNTSGTTYPAVNADIFKNFKLKLPKDKSLINNLQPLFDEVEVLHKEIKDLNETYNQYLQELSKAAIKNQEVLNNDNSYDNNNEDEEIKEESEEVKSETSSKTSLTVNELKEQCKSLGIKGYSKKNKEELLEMIKNYKSI